MKPKREEDKCPNRLCQRWVDDVVRLQAGEVCICEEEGGLCTYFCVANATK